MVNLQAIAIKTYGNYITLCWYCVKAGKGFAKARGITCMATAYAHFGYVVFIKAIYQFAAIYKSTVRNDENAVQSFFIQFWELVHPGFKTIGMVVNMGGSTNYVLFFELNVSNKYGIVINITVNDLDRCLWENNISCTISFFKMIKNLGIGNQFRSAKGKYKLACLGIKTSIGWVIDPAIVYKMVLSYTHIRKG